MGGAKTLSSYTIVFLDEAANDWREFDASVRKRLASAIERLKRNPEQYGKQLGQPLHRLRRVRSGDYRIV